jgi:protease-4
MTVTLLELDLTAPLLETPPHDLLGSALARRRPVLHDVVEGLRIAESDPDVAGLVAHIGGRAPSLAQIQELRTAVRRFAATGKVTVAWAETFGELGPGTLPYYLASAFDEVWLQPSGDLALTGVVAEAVFVKEALDKLGVRPQLSRRHEYKSAADIFLASRMTDAHREAAGRLAASAMEHIVTGIAERRRLAPERVRALIDEAPLSAGDAKDAGLVDRLGYRAEVYEHLRRRLGEVRPRFVHRYYRAKLLEPRRVIARLAHRPVVAVVHGVGSIHLGRSRRRGLSTSIGSDTLSAALRSAARDRQVRAVVLRVDSGGGSYVASDAIRHEIQRVRDTGKPLVVSMGSVAASGGYFISMAADHILAQPGTLTGSIGVLGGKAVMRDLLDRLGITRDGVAEGRHAWMFSTYRAFTEEEWQRLERWLDQVYDDFTAKVAADRGLTREQVEAVARGRVWSGADAQARGLVDRLGGLAQAVEIACARAGVNREEVEVRILPHLGLAERVRGPESSDDLSASLATGPMSAVSSLLVSSAGLPRGAHRPIDVLTDLLGVPRLGVLTAPVLWDVR